MPDSLEPPPSFTFLNAYLSRLLSCYLLRFSTDLTGKIVSFPRTLISTNRLTMVLFYRQLKSRVLCADILDDGTILVGTVAWYIHAFLLELRWPYAGCYFFIFWTKERQEAGLTPLYPSKMATPTNNRGSSVLLIRLFVFLTEYRFVPLRGKFKSLPRNGIGIWLT